MGLHRPSEPFHRIYSTPEPPSPARRPMLLTLLGVVVACAVAGAVVLVVVPGRDQSGAEDAAAVRPVPNDTSRSPVSGMSRIVLRLPPPCGTVSQATVDRTVPGAKRVQSGNSTLTTCTYSEKGPGGRWLRVEAHLHAPDDTAAPLRDAESDYDDRWAQAHDARPVRTLRLERHRGLGDEAYRWSKADPSEADAAGPQVIGQVTARTRNTVLTVSYGERASGKDAARRRERACLDRATAVAREVVTALNHF